VCLSSGAERRRCSGSRAANPDEVGVASDALVGERPDAVLRAVNEFVAGL